jgi:4-alpha-glucanotransferase
MRFAPLDRHFTGVAVPVAALRSEECCGAGEFADLVPLGRWCADAGLDLVQLLPVNDTGGNSSPYSAVSAFALHPLHVRLQDVPGAARYAEEMQHFREEAAAFEQEAHGRFSYPRVLSFKLSVLARMFADNAAAIETDPAFAAWREQNPWVVPYAVFTVLRKQNEARPWATWPELSNPAPAQVMEWWESHREQCLFPAWIQYHAEAQLTAASGSLHAMGIFLKGDLPILMSEESADVWAQRRYFDLSGRAGAPPDMFSPDGQNWGFPVYDWEALARDDYRWWKERLRQAGKFFHAFRIDHVLGFFRIWRIPRGELTGLLGRFAPSAGLFPAELRQAGFDEGRLRWLSVPHVSGAELAAALGAEAPRAADRYLRRVGTEELYNPLPGFDGEEAIQRIEEPAAVKAFLRAAHVDRTLLLDGADTYYPSWYRENTKGFRSLTEEEKSRLRGLIDGKRRASEEIWEKQGEKILSVLQGATDMLVCAEDLGDVPRCVPRVLARRKILGLRILRWTREWDSAGPGVPAPVILPERYPALSVCTPSVHDTSTLRGWWEEDGAEREIFFSALGAKGSCPARMSPELLEQLVRWCCGAGSLLAVLQLQDLLDLDEKLWAPDPRTDRINVPGTVNETNWTWRMPLGLRALAARASLSARIRSIAGARRARPIREPG